MQTYHAPLLDHTHARALWRGMQAQITEQSIAAAPQGYAWFKTVVLSAALLACLSAAWSSTSVLVLLALCVAIAFLLAQCAFLGHDAGHGSLHSRTWLSGLLGQWCMTVITGLCFEEWYARHSAHHRFCQDESRDPDIDVGVVVSLTAQARSRKRGLGLFMARYQHLHVWVLSLLFAYSQRHLSQWGALVSPLRYWRDLVGLALHLALWIALPMWVLDLDVTRVVVVYMLPMLVLGPYLAAIFWLNHIGMPLIGNTEAISFLEHQAITSRTVLSPKAMDWFFWWPELPDRAPPVSHCALVPAQPGAAHCASHFDAAIHCLPKRGFYRGGACGGTAFPPHRAQRINAAPNLVSIAGPCADAR